MVSTCDPRVVAAVLLLASSSCEAPQPQGTIVAPQALTSAATPSALEPVIFAHFIDVGQADATLLEFPCGAVLIDAGAQDDAAVEDLIAYLTDFFQGRPDLGNTLDSIIITHNHIDHTRGLRRIVETFNVDRFLESGHSSGIGTGNPNWVRREVANGNLSTTLLEILDSDVTAVQPRTGLTNAIIDPVKCDDCDPAIRVLSGRLDDNPGWGHEEFDNKNNHSIVTRVDFGEASFLFTGDLEDVAIDTMLDWYEGTDTLDVDVYQVGHHGSYNGTTADLVQAMTPETAVISCGAWEFGRPTGGGRPQSFTTFAYGHPRRVVVDLLSVGIDKRRSEAITAQVAEGARNFRPYLVRKKIYATPWDGTLRVRATLDGTFIVTRNH